MSPASDTESTASCARSPEPLMRTPLPSRQEEQVRTPTPTPTPPPPPPAPARPGACFRCKQEGHWQKDCPLLHSTPSPGTGSPEPAAAGGSGEYPEKLCPCGAGPCIVRKSRTSKNPDRDFYVCPQCGFFQWCIDVPGSNQSPQINSPVKAGQPCGRNSSQKPNQKHGLTTGSQNPICSCGAGPCIVVMMNKGEFFGRNYFACPVPKGQGACDQFQWCNSPASPCGGNEPNYNLVPKELKDPQMDEAKATEVNNVIKSGGAVVPTSPTQPVPSMREKREANYEHSLGRRLNFEGSPSKPEQGLKSTSVPRVNTQGHGTIHLVKWYSNPPDVDEAKKTCGINDAKSYKDEGLSRFNLVPELDANELVTALEAVESKIIRKLQDPKEAIKGGILDQSMVPTSPQPPSPVRDHVDHAGLLSSPMKRLNVDEGSPSKPGKVYRYEREGHWFKECTAMPTSPCYKCGKYGHWKNNCPS